MKTTLFMLVCGLTATATLFAGTATVTFTGPNGETDSYGNLISPYYGTINGANSTLYCDDFANFVSDGETWTANVTNLADSADVLTQTRYGGLVQTLATDGTGDTANYDGQQLYEMAAYLTTQFDGNATDNGNIQDTIWDLFNPNAGNAGDPGPIPSTEAYLYAAEQNYGSINAANFEILTQVNNPGFTGGIQEFIVSPEPSSTLLFGCGLMLVSGIVYRRRKANQKI